MACVSRNKIQDPTRGLRVTNLDPGSVFHSSYQSALATLSSLLFVKHIKAILTSGPLHVFFHLSRMIIPRDPHCYCHGGPCLKAQPLGSFPGRLTDTAGPHPSQACSIFHQSLVLFRLLPVLVAHLSTVHLSTLERQPPKGRGLSA